MSYKQIIKIFGKLWKTSRKGSLKLQKVQNWTTIAYTELIEPTQKKSKAHWNEEKYHSCLYINQT